MNQILRIFRGPALSPYLLLQKLGDFPFPLDSIKTEWCYYIQVDAEMPQEKRAILDWLLSETYQPDGYSQIGFLTDCPTVIEVGPRLNFETSFSSTAVKICLDCGIQGVARLERSLRVGFGKKLSKSDHERLTNLLYDRMTEQVYLEPLSTFDHGLRPESVKIISLIEEGMEPLRKINTELGLAMDDQDLEMTYRLFVETLKRNPTDVELFEIGGANSEHCRHGFFKGKLIIDGEEMPHSLFDLVKAPYLANPNNSVIAFHDDSSAIRGLDEIYCLVPLNPGSSSLMVLKKRLLHPTLTAETHNFPSGIAPFPGAMTCTGGRIRDNHAVGRGGQMIAGGAGYCVGNPRIPGFIQPWEEDSWDHPKELASPLQILIKASDGCSAYGNRIGEPVIYGFTRTYGVPFDDGFASWLKPIVYGDGIGQIDDLHTEKGEPEPEMLVVQIGGPAYRIGLGGGAASSMMQGDNAAELDFNAVQRGAAEMEQTTWRVIRACIEMGDKNPIVTIHDLGAGGDCNAVPEILLPAGGKIELRKIPLGDKSLSVLEYWGNESQERMVFLINRRSLELIETICRRESCPVAIIGEVVGDGLIVLHDSLDDTNPVKLPLGEILENLPRKTFQLERRKSNLKPLVLPNGLTVMQALELVLRLTSVGSKQFLTRKVDRSVTGLIIQQQCVGPNHLPLSDYAVIAQSFESECGIASSLGEQPIKGLISPEAMARLAVAEALLNMAGAAITDITDIRCSANWMWAGKLPGEGARLYDSALALRDILIELGIAIDGGKDSMSMAAKTLNPQGKKSIVKAPGELVIANYVTMADVGCRVTPVMNAGDTLIYLECNPGKYRLGGTALVQCLKQVGDECPDIDDIGRLKRIFGAIQEMVQKGLISACHDVSDGGLITTLLEMAFVSNLGLTIETESSSASAIEVLFSEEPGVVVAFPYANLGQIQTLLDKWDLDLNLIGLVKTTNKVTVYHNDEMVLGEGSVDLLMTTLREMWEDYSTHLDMQQANPDCVRQEIGTAHWLKPPPYSLSFTPSMGISRIDSMFKPKVAIIRTDSSNGDREMAEAFRLAGFDPWDVNMNHLLEGLVHLSQFQGIAFVGGFSYGDVLDSAKGWAGQIKFNPILSSQFEEFYQRSDTFSFGVCNGCQLMALLGWVPWYGLDMVEQPRFITNESERFESRFSAVAIMASPAIMLKNMVGSVLGVWVAHGEGRLHASDETIKQVLKDGLAPVRFIHQQGFATNEYPYNPNGSPFGITGLCSADGRHFALMPHPERGFQLRQWPWLPDDWKKLEASPWLQIFQNAYTWCLAHRSN